MTPKPRIFRDPVHGLIAFRGADVAIGDVLDTQPLQRLRRVRQMGFASLVYPGAEHSRFGHALGAFHVARRVAEQLALPPEIARDVKLGALLHDVGHGPFSHAWEEALGGDSHEEWGRRIVAEHDELRAALERIAPEAARAQEMLFTKEYVPAYARKLVSSQLDVDRMDYLLRDAHYSGVGYSAYDLDWIILALVRDGEDVVIDHRRGIHAVEQFLSGRFYMYAQVYYHKTVRAAECMFLRIMRRFAERARQGRSDEPPGLAIAGKLARDEAVGVGEYLALDDARVITALDGWASGEGSDPVLSDLAGRLMARRLFKTIEAGDDPAVVVGLEPELADVARRVLGDRSPWYWSIDTAERLGYDPRPGEEIRVVGHPRLGTVELGRVVKEGPLARQSFTVRVICAPELLVAFRPIVERVTRAA